MMRFIGMTPIRGSLLLALSLLAFACGRHETMASKSAAAYREAQAKGVPVSGGHEHGGHEASSTSAETIDHSTMDHSTMDHSTMDHSTMADHSAPRTGADPHAGHTMATPMDHSAHGATTAPDHAAMGHTGSAAADPHAGMQHDASAAAGNPHAQHGQPSGATAHAGHGAMSQSPANPAPLVLKAPATNAEIARMQPAATLQPDAFDAPAPIAVDEANKAAGKKKEK